MTNNTSSNQSINKEKLDLNPKVHISFIITTVIAYFLIEKIVINGYFIRFQSIFLLLSLLTVLIRFYISLGANKLFSNILLIFKGDKENPLYKLWNNRNQVLYLFLLLLPFFVPEETVNGFVKYVSQIFQQLNAFSAIFIFIIISFSIIGCIRSKTVYVPSKTPLTILFLISTWIAYYEITSEYEYLTFFDTGIIRLTFFIYLITYLELHFYLKSKYDNVRLSNSQNDEPPFFPN